MSHGGVAGDEEIQRAKDSGRIHEVAESRSHVFDGRDVRKRFELPGGFALLQADPMDMRLTEKRQQSGEVKRPPAVIGEARIARPDQAHACLGGMGRVWFRLGPAEISHRRHLARMRQPKNARQAHQGQMNVVWGRVGTAPMKFDVRKVAEQRAQGIGTFQDHASLSSLEGSRQVSGELEGVAQSLFGLEEQGASAQWIALPWRSEESVV